MSDESISLIASIRSSGTGTDWYSLVTNIWSVDNIYIKCPLIYRLSTDQILVIKEYQSVPVPEDLIEATNETESYDNKNQTNRFDSNHSIIQDDHSNNNNDYGRIHSNDKDDSEHESYDELDCSQQLNGMELYKII